MLLHVLFWVLTGEYTCLLTHGGFVCADEGGDGEAALQGETRGEGDGVVEEDADCESGEGDYP